MTAKTNYKQPKDVSSPKKRLSQLSVLFAGKKGGYAVAMGLWDGYQRLLMRWNGDESNSLGNPQSSGHSTWFVIPTDFQDAILDGLPPSVKKSVIERVRAFLRQATP